MMENWDIRTGINDYYNLVPLRYAVVVRDFFLPEVESSIFHSRERCQRPRRVVNR
jgi:hypothetical protein